MNIPDIYDAEQESEEEYSDVEEESEDEDMDIEQPEEDVTWLPKTSSKVQKNVRVVFSFTIFTIVDQDQRGDYQKVEDV